MPPIPPPRLVVRSPAQKTLLSTARTHPGRVPPRHTSNLPSSPSASAASPCPATPSAQQRWHSGFSSVNPAEVKHFEALAADWWSPYGSARLLHLMNPLRHDFVRRCLASSEPPPSPTSTQRKLRYLDIGCGGGIFAESAARLPATEHVTAIDPTPSVLAVARAHAKCDPALRGRLEYRLASVESLEAPPASYDVVTLFEVLEHVDDPAAVVERVRPFVRPGGWLVTSTIARTWASWLTTKVVAEHLLRIVPPGTHDWNKYINVDELRGYLAPSKGWRGSPVVLGVVYVPGLGWREVSGSENVGNYFFAVQREG